MIGNLARAGVKVPGGFATTTRAYREFLEIDGLGDRISQKLSGLDVGDVTALADTGKSIRSWLLAAPLPDNLLKAVAGAYQSWFPIWEKRCLSPCAHQQRPRIWQMHPSLVSRRHC